VFSHLHGYFFACGVPTDTIRLVLPLILVIWCVPRQAYLVFLHQFFKRVVPFLAVFAICLGLECVLEVGQQRRLPRLALGQQLVVRT